VSNDVVTARIRDLLQVEGLLAWSQQRYREQLTAWLEGNSKGPPPAVPESYRQAVARLQVALGHLGLAIEFMESPPPASGPWAQS
jgi:hypothetical protein